MTPEEMVDLTEFIAIACPQQKINRMTPVVWFEIIGHLDFDAARNAVIAVKHSQAFVDTSDIIREAEHASHRRAHPSERTVREAIEASTLRDLDAAPTGPPNAEYQQAKEALLERNAARDAAAMGDGPKHPPVPAAARRLAYAAACPWCGAQPGARCTNTVLGTPKLTPHAARVESGSKAA